MSKIVIVSHSTKGVEEYFRESTPPPFSIVFSSSQGHATQLLNLDYVHQLTPDAASSDCVSLATSVTATIPFSFIAGYAHREFPFVGIIVCDHHRNTIYGNRLIGLYSFHFHLGLNSTVVPVVLSVGWSSQLELLRHSWMIKLEWGCWRLVVRIGEKRRRIDY